MIKKLSEHSIRLDQGNKVLDSTGKTVTWRKVKTAFKERTGHELLLSSRSSIGRALVL